MALGERGEIVKVRILQVKARYLNLFKILYSEKPLKTFKVGGVTV